MLRTALVCLLALTFVASANASTVNVRLEATPPASGSCYAEGEVIKISVYYDNNFDMDLQLRLLQFSNMGMAAADAAGYAPWDGYNPDYPEFSEWPDLPVGGAFYAKFNTWTLPSAAYTGSAYFPGRVMVLSPMGSAKVGSFDYTMPDHTVTVDVANATETDEDKTARIRANFDTTLDLSPVNGGLTGGTIELCFIPEPATLGLLGVGALALLRRRR